MKWVYSRRGFTIVELLIVVVVIAILAAITIVAYNGITQRTKDTTAQSAATQATKKLALYAVDNTDLYPPDEATFLTYANLQDSGTGTSSAPSYQYSISSDRKTFCLTTTTNSLSYFTSNAAQTPQKGACPGHGVNGGGVVTNLATDPRATTLISTVSPGLMAWTNARPGSYSVRLNTGDGPTNISSYIRKTMTAVINGNDGFSHSGATGGTSPASTGVAVQAGEQYTASVWVRYISAQQKSFTVKLWWLNEGGARLSVTEPAQPDFASGTWSRLISSGTVPSGATRLAILTEGRGSSSWSAGDFFDATGLMLVKTNGPDYGYADPIANPAQWSWSGAVNNSSSSGPTQ